MGLTKGSFEVKFPTRWTDKKQRWKESEKRREEERKWKKRKSDERRSMNVRENVGKSQNTVIFFR